MDSRSRLPRPCPTRYRSTTPIATAATIAAMTAAQSATIERSTSRFTSAMTPVPRLVRVAVAVAGGIGKQEAEFSGAPAEPAERIRRFEFDLERTHAVGRDVDGASGVVLAVARRGADFEDRVERKAARQLRAHDLGLALDAAER